jgi:membrane-associated phospholipid phosphatase
MSQPRVPYLFFLFLIITSSSGFGQDSSVFYKKLVKDSLNYLPDTSKSPRKLNHVRTAGLVWKNLVLSSPNDFVEMGNSVKSNWTQTAAYFAGVSVFVLADKPVTQWYQDKVEKGIDYKLPKLPGSTGNQFFRGDDAYLNYSILGLYFGSLASNFEGGQRAALNSLKSISYSYLFVHVGLKAVFARQRPDPTLSDGKTARPPLTHNPYAFFHFRKLNFGTGPDGTSFPSFHATAYYSVAKVLSMEFNNYWIPYGAVSLIFFADLDSHKHWVGDMIAGGVLGTLIGKGIVSSSRKWEKQQKERTLNKSKRNKLHLSYQVFPVVSSDMSGLSLYVSL